ncbi:MAG: hypothetical protein QOH46_1907 [Solirubrobacteraceae bacterium]|nr:hypothetical protein [Solirubrobacteraceae bacterium]
MRLFLATLASVLALGSSALAQSDDLRAPDQIAPATSPTVSTDLRAPDQQAPAPMPTVSTDLRAPDQQAPAPAPAPAVPTPVSGGGTAAIVFVLVGLGAALVVLAAGYLGVRYRHRATTSDDLLVE